MIFQILFLDTGARLVTYDLFARFGYACITRVNSRRCNDCELHKGRSGEPAYCCRPPGQKVLTAGAIVGSERATTLFESVYDEHAQAGKIIRECRRMNSERRQ